MNALLVSLLVLSYGFVGFAHMNNPRPDPIRRINIERVLRTLTSDEMMGRPANRPERIEPAAAFLEKEFRSIGLEPLPGEESLRQRFDKHRIVTKSAVVRIDGREVPAKDILIASERTSFRSGTPLPIHRIADDSTMKDKRRLISTRYRTLLRDTAAAVIVVDESLREGCRAFRGFFNGRLAAGQPGTKIMIIGPWVGAQAEAEFAQEKEVVPMANIGGMIRGKSKPEEYVIFSAHYDHIGVLQAVAGDSVANGADDDATGTTAVVELARYFKKAGRQERTLLFVAFTAEEIGGFGSRYFSEQLNPDQVVAMFNIEMIGKPSKFGRNTAWITGFERSDFGSILQGNLNDTPFRFHPDPYPDQNLFYRSDNATLARLGVPAHSISTDEIDIDKRYHSVDDEFDSIDLDNLEATIRAIALSARGIIAGKETPKRIDKATVQGR